MGTLAAGCAYIEKHQVKKLLEKKLLKTKLKNIHGDEKYKSAGINHQKTKNMGSYPHMKDYDYKALKKNVDESGAPITKPRNI